MSRDASIGVNLIGRDVSASKSLKGVGREADKLGHKMVDVSDKIIKGMAMAATATAAAAVKIGYDAVKAAVEDQKSVNLLAQSIRTSTGATVAQTRAVEDYITQQQKRLGLDDGALRTSLGTLVRATGSVTKAQKLQNDALNISAMSGKDVQSVSLALAKAYTGNYGALSRMGISIDKATLKSKDFEKIMESVRRVSAGFADREAGTLEGKMRKIKVAFDEAKESLGYQLLPYVTKFAEYVSKTLVPAIQSWIDENGPKLRKMIEAAVPKVQAFLDKLTEVGRWAIDHKDTLVTVAKQIVAIMAAVGAAGRIYGAATALGKLVTMFQAVRTAAASASVATALATGGVNIAAGLAALAGAAAVYAGINYALNAGGDDGKAATVVNPSGTKWPLLGTQRLKGADGSDLTNWGSPTSIGGNVYNLTINGTVMTQDTTMRWIRDGLTQLNNRGGKK